MSLEHFRNSKGMATAYAGLGDAESCYRYTEQCLELDRERFGIVPIIEPFFADPALSAAGIEYLQKLDTRLPNTWWVHHNIGTLAGRLGQTNLEERSLERSRQLRAGP